MYSPVNNLHGRYSMHKRIQVIGIGPNERQRGISTYGGSQWGSNATHIHWWSFAFFLISTPSTSLILSLLDKITRSGSGTQSGQMTRPVNHINATRYQTLLWVLRDISTCLKEKSSLSVQPPRMTKELLRTCKFLLHNLSWIGPYVAMYN